MLKSDYQGKRRMNGDGRERNARSHVRVMVQAALMSGKIGLDKVTRRGCNYSYATLEAPSYR